mgnify:CR=1 FL=1
MAYDRGMPIPPAGPAGPAEARPGDAAASAPPPPPTVAQLERLLAGVLDAWRARYGAVVADVRVVSALDRGAVAGDTAHGLRGGDGGDPTDALGGAPATASPRTSPQPPTTQHLPPSGPRIVGTVLVPGQRDALRRSLASGLAAAGCDPDSVAVDVEALTERATSDGWLRGRDAQPVPLLDRAGGATASELLPSDAPARLLATVGDAFVVELADRTVGWAAAAALDAVPAGLAPASVAAWRAGWAGVARPVAPGAWRAAVEPWLGVPYRLGGRSRSGIDCSAFTQTLVKDVAGLGLPRHSRDQARFGVRVGLGEVAAGDLVHLSHLERGASHVVLVVASGAGGVAAAHACLDHAVVTVESLAAILTRYAFRAARRFPSGYRCPA